MKGQRIKLLCVVGPTATGKSRVALDLSEKFHGEIINADSRQFYRELNIGTAKPLAEARQGIPHHLIDTASIANPWTVADFIREADTAIRGVVERGRVPIIVGGTGMYIKGLLFGLDPMPAVDVSIQQTLQLELKQRGLKALFAELEGVDPEVAQRLSVNDTQRILRALGVYRQTGQLIQGFWKRDAQSRYEYLKIAAAVERKKLYEMINRRVDDMIAQGLKQEVLRLKRDYPDNPTLKKTIGYAEWFSPDFTGDDEITQQIKINTRHFAKRQLTWFRKEKEVMWLDFADMKNIQDRVEGFF